MLVIITNRHSEESDSVTNDPADPRNDPNMVRIPFIFVKHGDPPPLRWMAEHPGYLKVPAIMVPHGSPPPWPRGGARARPPQSAQASTPTVEPRIPGSFAPPPKRRKRQPGGQAWPKDKNGRDWPQDRWGRPMRPLWDYPPGVRAPGEGVVPGEPGSVSTADAINAYLRAEAMFADPVGMARAALVTPDVANLYATADNRPFNVTDPTGLNSAIAVSGQSHDGSALALPINNLTLPQYPHPGAEKLTADPGFFGIGGDGNPFSIMGKDGKLITDVATLADLAIQAGWQPGQPVQLFACFTGAPLPDGSYNDIAQQLANALRTEVIAPTTFGWVHSDGRFTIAPANDLSLNYNSAPNRIQSSGENKTMVGTWVVFSPSKSIAHQRW
jgi:hypothetical protein